MAASAGRAWAAYVLINGSYIPFAGLRTRSFKVNTSVIDVTTADSAGRWRELLPNGGIETADMDVGGVFQNDASAKAVLAAVQTNSPLVMRISAPGIQMDGNFFPSNFNADGPYNEATSFTCALMSSGAVTFTYS